MTGLSLRDRRIAFFGPLGAGCLVLVAASALLPSAGEIAAATGRALAKMPSAAVSLRLPPFLNKASSAASAEILMTRFKNGDALSESELRQLLASSTASADADTLSAIADRLGGHFPESTAQVSWAVLASGRPAVAMGFFEGRPDRAAPSLWRLRFELHRKAGDDAFAAAMVRSAATRRGAALPRDLVEAAYSLNLLDAVLLAAEHESIPRLDRARSRDLAQWAARTGRFDLIPRIDSVGDAHWRRDDPWLALRLAQRSGDTAAALAYADLLPSGRAEARKAIIMASGDKEAIRGLLLSAARANGAELPAAAEQLVQIGFRADALAILRSASADRLPDDKLVQRLLYLMGPRPDPQSLAWLKEQATRSEQWQSIYLERVPPSAALAFVESRPQTDDTDALILQLKFSSAARDKKTSARLLDKLLDGRRLSSAQLSDIGGHVPAGLNGRFGIALAKARVAVGDASPSDRLDLAWDAWNRRDIQQAALHLQSYLKSKPADVGALRLMADIEAKRRGTKAARAFLERALAEAPARSEERAVILERLGRKQEALELVESLRRESPDNKRLSVIHARLLIASGKPGRARKMLQP